MRSLDHPNVIKCYEVLKSCNNCYIVMEICEDGSLEKTLKLKKKFSEE
jgi:serine/threonine protein kinase